MREHALARGSVDRVLELVSGICRRERDPSKEVDAVVCSRPIYILPVAHVPGRIEPQPVREAVGAVDCTGAGKGIVVDEVRYAPVVDQDSEPLHAAEALEVGLARTLNAAGIG